MPGLKNMLRRNFWLKLAALGVAVTIWAFVVTRPEMERALEVELQYANVPRGLEINPDQADRVTVVVRGAAGKLDDLASRALSAEVDLSGIHGAGEHTFTVTGASLHLPGDVEFVRAVPSQLHLSIEKQVRRELPVAPSFVGVAANGYTLNSYTVDPPYVTVVGPESRTNLLGQVTTDRIDLSEVVGGRSFHVVAFVSDPYVRLAEDANVTVAVEMRRSP